MKTPRYFPLLVIPAVLLGGFSGVFSFPSEAHASTLWSENFEGYSTGDLNGQGSWSGGTALDVTSSNCQSGTRCLTQAGSGSNEVVKTQSISLSSTTDIYTVKSAFKYTSLGSKGIRLAVMNNDGSNVCNIGVEQRGIYLIGNGSRVFVASTTVNTYHTVEMYLDLNTSKCAIRYDSGAWSSEEDFDNTYTYITQLGIAGEGSTGSVFLDNVLVTDSSTYNNYTDTRIVWVDPPVQSPMASTETNEFDIEFQYYLNSSNSDPATFTKVLIQLFPLSYPNDPVQRYTAVASTTFDSLQTVVVPVATARNGAYLATISAWNGVSADVTCQWWDLFCTEQSVVVGFTASNRFNVATNTIAADVAPIFLPPEDAAQYCLNADGPISLAVCQTAVSLFIPSTEALTGFSSTSNSLGNKFPFSWFYGVSSVISLLDPNTSTATTTPSVRINFADAGVASTTGFAGILPNVTLFSTSTVAYYFPASVAQPFRYLITITLYLGLAYSAYRTIPALFRSST